MLATLLLMLTGSCGVRTAVSAEADWEDNDAGPKLMPCGYGPPCNPRNFGGQTCTSLGLRPGALSCDPKTCFLVLSGCGKSGSGGAGTTGGSTGTAGSAAPPLFGGQPMDAGPLFGGLFGTQPGGGTSGAMPGGTPMDDEDGGAPGFFGNGFFGGNPGTGFFGGNFFGGGANNNNNQGNSEEAQGDDPGN